MSKRSDQLKTLLKFDKRPLLNCNHYLIVPSSHAVTTTLSVTATMSLTASGWPGKSAPWTPNWPQWNRYSRLSPQPTHNLKREINYLSFIFNCSV